MPSATDIANYFLTLARGASGESSSISNLKLQKLLYYAQGYHLAMFGQPLFPEPIEAWKYGPVVKDLYHQYKSFTHASIPAPTGWDPKIIPEEYKLFVDDVFADLSHFNAWDLHLRTHRESPWRDSFDGSHNKLIRSSLLEQYFSPSFVNEVEDIIQDKDITRQEDAVLPGIFQTSRHLPGVIHFARRELNKRFGPDAQMTLQGQVDPEEGTRFAVLHVQTSSPPDEAMKQRDSFDVEWWFERTVPTLVIDFELVDV